ncbi:MAG: class I SAM-dependent methyltransferase [Ignavibacteria bacterium]
MNSKELGKRYDKIAVWWTAEMMNSDYGVNYVKKAIEFTKQKAKVLDIGCGSSGRIIDEALKNNLEILGIDLSAEMIRIAKEKYPGIKFINADFNEWNASEYFDLVIAWDSVFHSPKHLQKTITKKMCNLLTKGGVLLFTAGGIDGEIRGEMKDVLFEYGSINYLEYLKIIEEMQCRIILMERDQYPLDHMVFICQKI